MREEAQDVLWLDGGRHRNARSIAKLMQKTRPASEPPPRAEARESAAQSTHTHTHVHRPSSEAKEGPTCMTPGPTPSASSSDPPVAAHGGNDTS